MGMRTRSYKAVYRDKKNDEHYLYIRINPRLLAGGLALFMTLSVGKATLNRFVDRDTVPNNKLEDSMIDPNLELIDKILKEHPNMLVTKSISDYEVKFGDTLSEIASENGSSIARIEQLNHINAKDMLRTGAVIKVETVKPLPELDAEIVMLESYMYDYVFNSTVAEIARKEAGQFEEQQMLYRSILYGNPKSEVDLDPNGIYAQFIKAYTTYHDREEQLEGNNEEQKQNYINTLTYLTDELDERINLGGMTNILVNYNQYRIYCKNGNTKSDELVTKHTTVYD